MIMAALVSGGKGLHVRGTRGAIYVEGTGNSPNRARELDAVSKSPDAGRRGAGVAFSLMSFGGAAGLGSGSACKIAIVDSHMDAVISCWTDRPRGFESLTNRVGMAS